MKISKESGSKSSVTLHVTIDSDELSPIHKRVLKRLGRNVKIQGFRAGTAPQHLVEKAVDQNVLQAEFFEEAVNVFGTQAIQAENLRPVLQPEIELKKFVPFSLMEFDVKIVVLGDIKVADYKKIKLAKPHVEISDADVDDVVESLRQRTAERKEITGEAKNGDEVWIDFNGVDAKGSPISGAKGKDYPLILGSDTFIPGFEKNLLGARAGKEKTFTLAFPKDYGVKALASKKVTFTVKINKVEEIVLPELNSDFAAKAGPFKTIEELKSDIRVQLRAERERRRDQEYENNLIQQVTAASKIQVPEVLVDEHIARMKEEEKKNLVYRGQTWEEHLKDEGVTDEEHDDKRLRPQAIERLAASFVLAEIAELEGLTVTDEELDLRISLLKGQYGNDPKMLEMLNDLQYQRDIASRLLTEKVVDFLVQSATE